jgi:hypothetical protein
MVSHAGGRVPFRSAASPQDGHVKTNGQFGGGFGGFAAGRRRCVHITQSRPQSRSKRGCSHHELELLVFFVLDVVVGLS